MEDTLQKTEKENELLIAEMLRDAKVVELPSELRASPVVHTGDEILPSPMTVKQLSSAGYVYVWDSRTYEKIPIIYYMLPSKLRLRRPDGSFRFTTTDPHKQPERGTLKCMLHPEGENRKHYDTFGFRFCKKNNITNPYQLEQHMVKKHPQEWAAIKAEVEKKEKAEDRALQHLLLANQARVMESKPASNPISTRILGEDEYYCSECESIHRATSKIGRRHLKKQG